MVHLVCVVLASGPARAHPFPHRLAIVTSITSDRHDGRSYIRTAPRASVLACEDVGSQEVNQRLWNLSRFVQIDDRTAKTSKVLNPNPQFSRSLYISR